MSGYASWEVYSTYYGEITDQSTFDRLNHRVSRLVDTFTGNRAKTATGEKAERVSDCVCELIDIMAGLDKSGAGRGIASVSNDGYSETYTASEPADVVKILRRAAYESLSGTGLMGAL